LFLRGALFAHGLAFQDLKMTSKMHKYIIALFIAIFSMNALAFQNTTISSMQRTISGVIQSIALKRGFTLDDPRFNATLNLMSSDAGSVAGTVAAAVVLGSVSAPAWASIAIAIGVGTVVNYGITLAIDGVVDWIFSPNGGDKTPITQKKKQQAENPTTGGLVEGGQYWKTNNYMASDAMSTIQAAFADAYNSTYSKFTTYGFYLDGCGVDSPTTFNCIVKRVSKTDGTTVNYSNFRASFFSSGAPRNCPVGKVSNNTGCVTPAKLPETIPDLLKLPLQEAINNLAPAELEKELSPEIIVPLIDKMWRDAASKPGYNGLPYRADDPVTSDDVEQWRKAHPQDWPKLKDFVNPQPSENQPWTLPKNPIKTEQDPRASTPTDINPAANNPLQNIGPDPVVGAPKLEATPTALQILQPLLNLFPDFRAFSMPSHQSVCPKPSFNAFGSTYVLESHCKIAEEQRSILLSVMAAVWLLAAAIIILRA
jgi:hypothetical protein